MVIRLYRRRNRNWNILANDSTSESVMSDTSESSMIFTLYYAYAFFENKIFLWGCDTTKSFSCVAKKFDHFVLADHAIKISISKYGKSCTVLVINTFLCSKVGHYIFTEMTFRNIKEYISGIVRNEKGYICV